MEEKKRKTAVLERRALLRPPCIAAVRFSPTTDALRSLCALCEQSREPRRLANLCSAPGNALGICSLSLSLCSRGPRSPTDSGRRLFISSCSDNNRSASSKPGRPAAAAAAAAAALKCSSRSSLFYFTVSVCRPSVSSHGFAFCLHLTYLKKRVILGSPSFFSCLFKCLLSKYSPPSFPSKRFSSFVLGIAV